MFSGQCRKLALLALIACSSSTQAAIVHLSGTTVDFYYDDAMAGMSTFGTLSAAGDSIMATPTDFLASATNTGSDSITATGMVTITAKSGYSFSALQFVQQGDYTVFGSGASVSASGTLTIEDANNSSTFDSSALSVSGLGTVGSTANWNADASFDLSSPTWDNVTSIKLSLASLLEASSSTLGEQASIQSKVVGSGMLTIETTVVPVPAAVWLFGSGLIALAGLSRRRRK